jgi:hypothetical protein
VSAAAWVQGNEGAAEQELRKHLREHLEFERNTVWQDQVEMERKKVAAKVAEAARPHAWWGPKTLNPIP